MMKVKLWPCAAGLLLVLASCGHYANVGEKLDVTTQIAEGQTWIAGSADGTNINVLVLGPSAGGVPAPFSFVSEQFGTTAGTSSQGLQGTWVNEGATASFQVEYAYYGPDQSSIKVLSRGGNYRDPENGPPILVSFAQTATTLTLGTGTALDGSYVQYENAVAALESDEPDTEAACAAEISILAMNSIYLRVIGFGGVNMTQYQSPETFQGTISGSATVKEVGYTNNTTTFSFDDLSELSGTLLSGVQVTNADISGDGQMSGSLTVTINPQSSGANLTPIVATVYYDGDGNSSNAIQISNGEATGGDYIVTLPNGGTASLPPVPPPSPSMSITYCLALP